MITLKHTQIRFFGFLAAATLALASCSDDIGDAADASTKDRKTYYTTSFSFSVAVPSTSLSRSVTAPTADAYQGLTPGVSVNDYRGRAVNEDLVTDATVFIVPVEGGVEDWAGAQTFTMSIDDMERTIDGYNIVYTKTFNESITAGKKHVYTALNLTTDLINQFKNGSGVFRALDLVADDYDKTVSRFINQQTGAIAMSGDRYAEVTVGPMSTDEYGNNGSPTSPFRLGSYDMQRMVAKILFTCATTDKTDVYAKIQAKISSEYQNQGLDGWMRLSSVRFKLGTTNRTTYLTQQLADGSDLSYYTRLVVDPNHKSSDILKYDSDGFDYNLDYANDFTYYRDDEDFNFLPLLSPVMGDNPPSPQSESTAMGSPAYYERLIPSMYSNLTDAEKEKIYTTGMYCLENTTDNDWTFVTDLLPSTFSERRGWFNVPRRLATNIIIETQYIPAVIVGEDCVIATSTYGGMARLGGDALNLLYGSAELTPYCFTDGSSSLKREPSVSGTTAEERARQFLINESEEPELKQPTYFALEIDGDYVFFTYKAAKKFARIIEDAAHTQGMTISEIPYCEYINGLGYYQTYLNQVSAVSATNPMSDAFIQDVLRNNYYIVNGTCFSVPAGCDNDFQTISFGCTWLDWVKSGSYEEQNVSPVH